MNRPYRVEWAGKRFGRWTVLRLAPSPRRKIWVCKCDCGTEKPVAIYSLKSGISGSCGCLSKKAIGERSRTHGRSKSKMHYRWCAMIQRCENPNSRNYSCYGARGIRVCDRWRHSFEAFLADMGTPDAGMTLERIDNNGNYEPGNVRWASRQEQCANTRRNKLITHAGKTMIMKQWARHLGIGFDTLKTRIQDGWSIERALTQPVR